MRLKKLAYFKFNATKSQFEYYCTNNDCWSTPANLNSAEIELADRDAKHISELKNGEPSEKYYKGREKTKQKIEFEKKDEDVTPKTVSTNSTEEQKDDLLKKLFEEQKRTNAFLEMLIESQNQQKDEIKEVQKEIYYLKYQVSNLKDTKEPNKEYNMIEFINNLRKLEQSSEKTLTRLQKIDEHVTDFFPV